MVIGKIMSMCRIMKNTPDYLDSGHTPLILKMPQDTMKKGRQLIKFVFVPLTEKSTIMSLGNEFLRIKVPLY